MLRLCLTSRLRLNRQWMKTSVRKYNTEKKHESEEKSFSSEVTKWEEEEEKVQQRLHQRSIEFQKKDSLVDQAKDGFKKLNNAGVYVLLGTGALILFDIYNTQYRNKGVEVSPHDPNVHYVRKNDGDIQRYYVKKAADLSYVTIVELDENLRMNGKSITNYADGGSEEYILKDGFREGYHKKVYSPGNSILYATWENVNDEQRGLKYQYFPINPEDPLCPVVEIFEAKSHLPISSGYYCQELVNGDKIVSRMGGGGVPHGSATLTTKEGKVYEGLRYSHGNLSGLPEEYLAPYIAIVQANFIEKQRKEEEEEKKVIEIKNENDKQKDKEIENQVQIEETLEKNTKLDENKQQNTQLESEEMKKEINKTELEESTEEKVENVYEETKEEIDIEADNEYELVYV